MECQTGDRLIIATIFLGVYTYKPTRVYHIIYNDDVVLYNYDILFE